MKKARLEENIRHGHFKGLEVTDVLKAVQRRAQRREARFRRGGTLEEPASDVTISQQQIRPGSAAAYRRRLCSRGLKSRLNLNGR